eukprot:10666452-Karenia_brevis.AAC.1
MRSCSTINTGLCPGTRECQQGVIPPTRPRGFQVRLSWSRLALLGLSLCSRRGGIGNKPFDNRQ